MACSLYSTSTWLPSLPSRPSGSISCVPVDTGTGFVRRLHSQGDRSSGVQCQRPIRYSAAQRPANHRRHPPCRSHSLSPATRPPLSTEAVGKDLPAHWPSFLCFLGQAATWLGLDATPGSQKVRSAPLPPAPAGRRRLQSPPHSLSSASTTVCCWPLTLHVP